MGTHVNWEVTIGYGSAPAVRWLPISAKPSHDFDTMLARLPDPYVLTRDMLALGTAIEYAPERVTFRPVVPPPELWAARFGMDDTWAAGIKRMEGK